MDKIEVCKKCTKKKFDPSVGIICGLTNQKPTFNEICNDFEANQATQFKEKKIKEAIRPNKQRAEYAQWAILAIMILDAVSIVSSYFQYDLLETLNNGIYVSDQVIDANDNREMVIGILYLVGSIVSGITFIMWFRRAYFNLSQRTSAVHSDGWAAGAWFVPIISLFRPFQIMKEMWVETSKIITAKTNTTIENDGTAILNVWWTLWIVSHYVGKYVIKASVKGETIGDYINATIGDIILSLIGIPLAYVTIKIIKAYSHKEEQLYNIENDNNSPILR